MAKEIFKELTRFYAGSRVILLGWPQVFIDVVQYKTGDYAARWFVLFDGYSETPYARWSGGGFIAERDEAGKLKGDVLDFFAQEAFNFAKGYVLDEQLKEYQKRENHLVMNGPDYTEKADWQDEVVRLRLRGLPDKTLNVMKEAALSIALFRAVQAAEHVQQIKVRDVYPGATPEI